MQQNTNTVVPARDRLLAAGVELFSKNGFAGTSIREICNLADTGVNMIHHYFTNKQGLYDEILEGFSDKVWLVPARIIAEPPRSRENLISRFEVFIEETLEALITHRRQYEMVVRERIIFSVFESYNQKLVTFLEAGKSAGYVQSGLDSEMLTGFILDRLGNQIVYASWIEETTGNNIVTNAAYRKRWLRANLDLIFHGVLA